ncbi:PAS domain-containing sensor histidine kinase [Paucihalobacter ruber]|uniref:histidine kinase n=1 Tax=Paucihalobacter ruber TaxID=2567861 RepID=A0A506PD43_9FLAO|nr:PAS domain-containing sensor histidine kinase [Paucihalobacter ruber]TPV31438.1 PAS domain-containing sensor histidine kinase [Paucihalobacter ruber]
MIQQAKNKVSIKEHYIPNAEICSQIIDSLKDYSILTVDKELNINSWNSGAVKIFQYTKDEIIGKPFEIIFTEEDKKNGIPKKEIETALAEGKSKDIRWHLCKDSTTFYADGLVFPLKNEENEVMGFVKILRDITKRKASEDAINKYAKELEDLNRHKETVLAILSHDLRSPLAGIIQGAEYLKLNYEILEPEFAQELLEELHTASISELNMLDYLVEWARIKYAAEAFAPAKIELVDYVNKVFQSLKETAAIKTIVFHNAVEEESSVYADGKMLISILQNIVSNAIKHSHDGGKIMVSAKKRDHMIIVEIKDTGRGMSKEIQEKLFTPEVISLSKTVEENKGAGIGLILVKSFLERNGGHIWVESVEGNGSSFYFTLPIEKPAEKVNILEDVKCIGG